MNVSFEKHDTFTMNSFFEGCPQGKRPQCYKGFCLNILSIVVRYLLSLTFINPVKNNQSFTRIIDSASGLEQLQNLSYVKSSLKQMKCTQFKKYLMFINIRHSQEWQCNRFSCWQIIAYCREVLISARNLVFVCFSLPLRSAKLGQNQLVWVYLLLEQLSKYLISFFLFVSKEIECEGERAVRQTKKIMNLD